MLSIARLRQRLVDWRIAQLDAGRELVDWRPDDADRYCPRCGLSAGPGAVRAEGCSFCAGERLAWHRLTRLGEYEPPLDDAIKAMKFGRDWARAGWFGRQLARRVTVSDPARTLVVPVPMHRFRQWRRGYNQAALIADALAAARGLSALPLLRRVRHTPPQSRLSRTARRANVVRAFAMHPVDLAGHDVLLIDDVKTTGSTLAGCAQALTDHGARSVHCVVVAVADPRQQAFLMT